MACGAQCRDSLPYLKFCSSEAAAQPSLSPQCHLLTGTRKCGSRKVWVGGMPPGGAGSQGCLRLRGVVVRLQPSQHKEFPFFWQKKKDEILKAWLKGYCIDIIFFSFCSTLLWCCSERQQPVRAGGMPCQRAGSGAEAREKEENCLRFLISGLSVNADASTPPQPLGL